MAFFILCKIMLVSNNKDFIENGFSEKAKLKIKGYDKIRDIWGNMNVEFHDSEILSLNMSI